SLSPEMFRFFSALDLFDMYHSLWFRLLMGCLTLNLIICSIDRFPRTLRRIRVLPKADRSKPFENLPPQQSLLVQGHIIEVAKRAEQLLKKHYKKIHTKAKPGTHFFYGEKGRYSHFGVYIVHLSVLTIFIGALVGSLFGFQAYVNIPSGDQIDTVNLRKGGKPLKLGFEVRCNNFTVDFYESGAPKEYRSELSFLVQGEEVEKRSLLVNHPVEFKGVTFYQSSYGSIPGNKARLKILYLASTHKIITLEAKAGDLLPLPGNEGKFQIADVKGNFMKMGPAVLISVQPNQGKEKRFWVFQHHESVKERFPQLMNRFPKLNPSIFKPYTFFLEKLETRYYTGLQVNRDPGVFVVWLGFFLMIVGFVVTFFTSHRRLWLRISRDKDGVAISVAGTSSKNPVGLQRELESITNDLRNQFLEKE
ncbi:MAG: cytochrome c biogenesis protein ResB, partial [Desulfobacteraceae bacterium]|nr:cytochrome c biogenesis protein ResB [Desulfobacteraceae bacterium]